MSDYDKLILQKLYNNIDTIFRTKSLLSGNKDVKPDNHADNLDSSANDLNHSANDHESSLHEGGDAGNLSGKLTSSDTNASSSVKQKNVPQKCKKTSANILASIAEDIYATNSEILLKAFIYNEILSVPVSKRIRR